MNESCPKNTLDADELADLEYTLYGCAPRDGRCTDFLDNCPNVNGKKIDDKSGRCSIYIDCDRVSRALQCKNKFYDKLDKNDSARKSLAEIDIDKLIDVCEALEE